MAKQTALQRAVRDMAQGSKQAFRVFYLSTIPYIYSSARLLYESHEQACGFTIDVYQYLYLHLPEYRAGEDLEKWISKHMMERYSQLSIGRPLPTHSVRTQSQSTALILEESERERIWRQLSAKIHFPKEQPRRRSRTRLPLLISALLLMTLLLLRYAPRAARLLSENTKTDAVQDTQPDATDATDTPDADTSDAADDLDAINAFDETDEINNLDHSDQLDQITVPNDSDASDDPANGSDFEEQKKQQSDASAHTNQTERTAIDALEDYELQSYYGDSLYFIDDD